MWLYSSLPFSYSLLFTMLKLQDAILCWCATETMHEIYWPRVPPFDTQDMANRSCAISHIFRLLCKADLSCLQAIFKPWAPETYGTMGNFIINALHLSDLIQACHISCQSIPYIYTLLLQTRAPVTNLTINTLAGVMPGKVFLWTALRGSHKIIGSIYSAHHLGKSVRGIKKKRVIFHEVEGWPESQTQRDLTFWRISVDKMS